MPAVTIRTIADFQAHRLVLRLWCPEHGLREVDLVRLAARLGADYDLYQPDLPIACGVCGKRATEFQAAPKGGAGGTPR